jgi:diguanylate cyclase (GGDEF)-like protein
LAVVIGGLAAAVGFLILAGGWALGIEALKSALPGLVTMKANTAFCFIAEGAGLALAVKGGRSAVFGKAMAAVALMLGAVTVAEYALPWNAGIDQLLFADPAASAYPGRPALATAVGIALLGAGVLCVNRPRARLLKSAAGVAAMLIAWAAINGYVFGVEGLQAVPLYRSVAIHSATVMLLLGFAVLAAEPTFWPVRTAFESSPVGVVCRWLLPAAVLAPPSLGWLLGHAAPLSGYPADFRWATYSVVTSLGSVWLVTLLARRISAMDAERAAATELSRHDPLTGLANRRAFDGFLLESFSLAQRHGQALSLILLDVDRFKSYNDAYGHPAGDELLKDLGGIMLSVTRETDLVARIGGEEFALVLPQTGLEGAEALGERVRVAVERSTSFRRPVTVSLGVAVIREETAGPATLVHDCDMALYRAKGAGRNRVSVAIAA